MKVRVKIVSFSVLQNAISIRLLCENAPWLSTEARDEKRKVSLDDLSFEAKIRSVNIQREGTNILLRTKRNRFVVGKLFDLMSRPSLEFTVTETLDGKLSHLLSYISKKSGESEENLLFKLTTFRDKDGKEVMGKRLIEDLTENQKIVVLKKLSSMLQQEEKSCSIS